MQTSNSSIKPALAIEIAIQIATWLVFSSAEVMSDVLLRYSPPNFWYYVINLSVSLAVFLIVRRFGNPSVDDFLDLCLYEIAIQVFGLAAYFLHYDATAYIALTNAVMLLKCARLAWTRKTPDGSGFEPWPVFGVLGYLKSARQPARPGAAAGASHPYIYLLFFFSIPLGSLSYYNLGWATLEVLPLCFVFWHIKSCIHGLTDMQAQYQLIVQEVAKARATSRARAKAQRRANQQRDQEMAAAPSLDIDTLILNFQSMRTPDQKAVAQLIHDTLVQYPAYSQARAMPELRLVATADGDF